MNKADTYCYVNRKQLENKRARICFYYSNQHPNPKERIEVIKSGAIKQDLESLSELVKSELPGRRKVKIEKEKEVCTSGIQKITIEKYFVCVQ